MKFTRDELLEYLDLEKQMRDWDHAEADYRLSLHNGFEFKQIDVIVPKKGCKWDLTEMEWGFIPEYWWTRKEVEKHRKGFVNDQGRFIQIIGLNAKGEELLLPNKIFRDAALKRRCLIPATEFYDSRHIFPIGKKGKQLKTPVTYPYRVSVKESEVFFMAGVWEPWTDRETNEMVNTCSIVTTGANSLMEQIHNSKKRMPVILTEELAGEWISDGLSEERITEIANYQFPAKKMSAHTIRKDFLKISKPNEEFIHEGIPDLVFN